jgi:hypothetical protein
MKPLVPKRKHRSVSPVKILSPPLPTSPPGRWPLPAPPRSPSPTPSLPQPAPPPSPSKCAESSARVAPRGEQRACGAMMAACAARRRWSGSLWERYAALGHGPDVLRAAASELQREAGARPRVVVSYAGLLSVYEAAVLAAQRVHVAWGGLATPVRV